MDDYLATPVTRERLEVVVEQGMAGGAGPLDEAGAALDHGVLATLRELEQRGQPGLLMRVVALYLQEAPAQLAVLQEAVAHGDAGRVEQAAHTLKGSSAQLGATRMARLCAALQEEGARQELGQAAAQVDELANEFVRVQAALETMVSETGFS